MIEKNKEIREVEVEEHYCDLCKQHFWEHLDNGAELKVDSDDNYNYGDCGYKKTYIYDICGDCVKNILFPFIKEKVKEEPRVEEHEW